MTREGPAASHRRYLPSLTAGRLVEKLTNDGSLSAHSRSCYARAAQFRLLMTPRCLGHHADDVSDRRSAMQAQHWQVCRLLLRYEWYRDVASRPAYRHDLLMPVAGPECSPRQPEAQSLSVLISSRESRFRLLLASAADIMPQHLRAQRISPNFASLFQPAALRFAAYRRRFCLFVRGAWRRSSPPAPSLNS